MVIGRINDMINRINDALIARIRRKSGAPMGPIVVDGDSVRMMDGDKPPRWSIAWADVVRITALWHPNLVGESIVATIEATGQAQFVAEEQEGWAEFARALPEYLPGALPFEQWALRLLAGGDEATVAVYERGA